MPKFSSIYPKLLHNKESIPVVFSDFIAPATITQTSNPPGDVSAKTTIAFRQRGDGLTLPATTVSHLVPLALRQLCDFILIVAIIGWHQKWGYPAFIRVLCKRRIIMWPSHQRFAQFDSVEKMKYLALCMRHRYIACNKYQAHC